MKSTGIVRRIDDLGRVVIPREIRNILLLQEGDPLEMFINGDEVVLKKYAPNYEFYERLDDLERRFIAATDIVGHKNTKEITKRFKEIKELWVDTEINE